VRLHHKVVETVRRFQAHDDRQRFAAIAQASIHRDLQLIAERPPRLEAARLLTTVARDAYWTTFDNQAPQDWEPAERFARRAVEMAEGLDAPVELSAALDVLTLIYGARGFFRERIPLSLWRLALSRDPRFGDRHERVSVLWQAGNSLSVFGEYARALRYLLEADSLAGEIRDVSQQAHALRVQAECWFALDRWGEMRAIEGKRKGLERSYGVELLGRLCSFCGLNASVLELRGELDLARARREEVNSFMLSYYGGPPEMWNMSIWAPSPTLPGRGAPWRVCDRQGDSFNRPGHLLRTYSIGRALVNAASRRLGGVNAGGSPGRQYEGNDEYQHIRAFIPGNVSMVAWIQVDAARWKCLGLAICVINRKRAVLNHDPNRTAMLMPSGTASR
jgi:hypothetical protein